jgi:hypothetical protein
MALTASARAACPWDQELWRLALIGVDQTTRARYSRELLDLEPAGQDDVLAAVQKGQAGATCGRS